MADQTSKPKGTFAKLMSSSPLQEEHGHVSRTPETPKSGKPENLKSGIQEIRETGKTENLHSGNREYLKAIKYSTQLHPDLIKQLKQFALVNDVKDYEVVQEALTEYLTKKQS
jgi:hypothetical protein